MEQAYFHWDDRGYQGAYCFELNPRFGGKRVELAAENRKLSSVLVRAFILWALIAGVEVIHGVLRVKFLNRPCGDRRARQIGVVTGSALNLFLAWLALPWLGAVTKGELLAVGALWLGLMLAFDLGVGRAMFHFSWARIARDFNLRQGGWLAVGMGLLFLSPLLAAALRGPGEQP